jgi:hypothetical protein
LRLSGRSPTRPLGIVLLTLFFELGALLAALAAASLLTSGGPLEPIWRLNPPARAALAGLGSWGIVLMTAVALGCGGAALGLWTGRRWGHRLATGVLAVNLMGDTANALFRGDWRTLIGLPIGGLLLAYLWSERVRSYFAESESLAS